MKQGHNIMTESPSATETRLVYFSTLTSWMWHQGGGLSATPPERSTAQIRGRQRRTETNNPIISPLTALMSWFQSLRDEYTLRPFEIEQTRWVSSPRSRFPSFFSSLAALHRCQGATLALLLCAERERERELVLMFDWWSMHVGDWAQRRLLLFVCFLFGSWFTRDTVEPCRWALQLSPGVVEVP